MDTYKATEMLLSKIALPMEQVTIPASKDVYDPNIIDIPESGKIDVMPMITEDERLFASATAFTSGNGIYQLIRKRVPSCKQPEALYAPDVLFLIAAIRALTFTSEYEVNVDCSNCSSKFTTMVDSNNFSVKQYSKEALSETIVLSNGQSVVTRHLTFKESIDADSNDQHHFGYISRIVSVDTIEDRHAIGKWFSALPIKLKREIEVIFDKELGGFDTKTDVNCPHCESSNSTEVNLLAGFFTQLLSRN